MDFNVLKKDRDYILSNLYASKSNEFLTKKPLTIVFPKSFEEKGLAVISKTIQVVGYFAIVIDDKFHSLKLPMMISLGRGIVKEIKINEDSYYAITFKENTPFISNNKSVEDTSLTETLLDMVIIRGNIPAYYNYDDLLTFFENNVKFANVKYLKRLEVLQLITALLARDKNDPKIYYRNTLKEFKDIQTKPVEYVSLFSVSFAANSTFSKLVGSYFTEGVNSSLINQSKEVNRIEALLRQ